MKPLNYSETIEQQILIPLPPDFNYELNLDYLANEKSESLYTIHEKKIRRIIQANQVDTLIEISYHPNHFLICIFLKNTRPTMLENRLKIIGYIYDWFDLSRELAPFYSLAEKDNVLKKCVSKFYGLRLIGIPDLFEALAWGIIGQQINLSFAYTLKRRLIETYGESIIFEDKKYWSFPKPAVIARLATSDLTNLQLSQKKSDYLIGIAQLIASKKLSKEKLLTMDNFAASEKTLTDLYGIGPWTANYVLMRCLRYPEAFPVTDVGLLRAIQFSQNLEQKPTKKVVLNYAKAWKNWESYATFYLWRLLY
ncbi:DNA-3-methyladenine glycosylase family protein [Carnobacterium maltaromaticum]|uniref:DNA-3-methyladenine glycosylase family protein n=1 Tax=Carnobacterium maltaromaticum TaxID=2751 RepID=UPI0012F8008D|nr:DNA-3-methyladenine glycosylase [Carnobacterium maltaromaticum]